jgi:integrase/recombinase XerD
MSSLDSLFEQFLRERTYLKNVSPKTRTWYETAWKAFTKTQSAGFTAAEIDGTAPLTRAHLTTFVVSLRDRGIRPVTVNTWLGAINAYSRWLHEEGHLREQVRLQPLRLEKRFVTTLDETALRALLRYKPKGYAQWRVHAAASTILDTGCRIEEILTARVRDFDFENLLLTVVGKGDKQRIVPFGFALRKQLFRFGQLKSKLRVVDEWMFPARDGGRWHHRNALRSYYLLLGRLHLPKSGFHRLRHTFATEYLKHGGDVVRLSKILGHAEVSTTMKYLHLVTADLQAPHERLSLLNRFR